MIIVVLDCRSPFFGAVKKSFDQDHPSVNYYTCVINFVNAGNFNSGRLIRPHFNPANLASDLMNLALPRACGGERVAVRHCHTITSSSSCEVTNPFVPRERHGTAARAP
jgi:hypothetical protein